MAKSLTIDEVKKKKIDLESAILKLVNSFETETGTFVSYIDFERKTTKSKEDKLAQTVMPEPERQGPVENINVNMRFDL
jgi:hypothetical protein